MRMTEAGRVLVGGIVVYVVMAACAAGDGGPSGVGDPGSSAGPEGSGGVNVREAGGPESRLADAMAPLVDAIAHPVPDAKAQSSSGSRLRAKYMNGADGSKQFLGWYDSLRKEDCNFGTASDGSTRCLPAATAYPAGSFSDAGCTQVLVGVSKTATCAAAVPKYVATLDTTGCSPRFEVRGAGARFTGTDIYAGTPASCTKLAGSSVAQSLDLYTPGAILVASDFVQGMTVTE